LKKLERKIGHFLKHGKNLEKIIENYE